jgi:hypothetical protein
VEAAHSPGIVRSRAAAREKCRRARIFAPLTLRPGYPLKPCNKRKCVPFDFPLGLISVCGWFRAVAVPARDWFVCPNGHAAALAFILGRRQLQHEVGTLPVCQRATENAAVGQPVSVGPPDTLAGYKSIRLGRHLHTHWVHTARCVESTIKIR